MKRYLVTEEQLLGLMDLANKLGKSVNYGNWLVTDCELFERMEKLVKVPKSATHFARIALSRDYDYPMPYGCSIAECVIEEIPKV